MPAEVPFDFDASVLPDSWVLQWVDQFAGVPQFTVVPPETGTGEGSIDYRDELTQCEIIAFAGPDSTPLGSTADDRTLTDTELSRTLSIPEDAIKEFAFDHTISQPDQNGTIAARLITTKFDDGSQSLTAARVIESLGEVAYVWVYCPGGDAESEYDMLMASGLLGLTAAPPPG